MIDNVVYSMDLLYSKYMIKNAIEIANKIDESMSLCSASSSYPIHHQLQASIYMQLFLSSHISNSMNQRKLPYKKKHNQTVIDVSLNCFSVNSTCLTVAFRSHFV
jgi:hypothetical protein